KALAVNISDICAMGAKPIGFFLNLIFSEKISKEFLKGLFSEMSTLCNTLGIVLAGGDISRGPILGLSITIWGESRSYLKRSPKPGDLLFVVGEIGLSKTGFFVLEECRDLKDEFPVSVRHFLRPPIFVEEALNIANFNGVHALMDISDGLIKDLHRFVGNNLGTKLFSESFSVHEEIKKIASIANLNPLEIMLSGGEDYALLGSVGREYLDKLKKMVPIRVIGEVVLRKGIWLDDKPLEVSGFDHFVN
ncbi:MAG: thiamine-phosphate kinase, partial [Candidatus Korarchaeota archaeon]|nr:thiamine-phosphate kinase [Candidatus Korarchaeota archaeon]